MNLVKNVAAPFFYNAFGKCSYVKVWNKRDSVFYERDFWNN
jgi:hypothetical protein